MQTLRSRKTSSQKGAAIASFVIFAALAAVATIAALSYRNQRIVTQAQALVQRADAHADEYDETEKSALRVATTAVRSALIENHRHYAISQVQSSMATLEELLTRLPKGAPDSPLEKPLLVVHIQSQFDANTGTWRSDYAALAGTWFLQDAAYPPDESNNIRINRGDGTYSLCHIDQGPFGPYSTRKSLRTKLSELGILDQYSQYK
jgi:hypothetical protein